MGTNFYLRSNPCPHCGRYDELHVGKSSVGWSFTFQATDAIRSLADWRRKLAEDAGPIVDEYGETWTREAFFNLVEGKRGERSHAGLYPGADAFLDPEGHSFMSGDFS